MKDNTCQVTEDICKFLADRNITYHIPFEGRIIASFKHFNIRIWFEFKYDFTNNPIIGRVDTKFDVSTNTRIGNTLPEVIEINHELSKGIKLGAELIVEFGNVDVYKYIHDVNQELLDSLDQHACEDMYAGLNTTIAKVSNKAYIPIGQLIVNNGCTYKVVNQNGNEVELVLDHIDYEKHDADFAF